MTQNSQSKATNMATNIATSTTTKLLAMLILIAGLSMPAFAHIPEEGLVGGFAQGYVHPLFGWDHVAAMIAVGIWGALLGGRAIWVLPVVFPFVMVIGGIMGMIGVPLPEASILYGIAGSSIIIGLAIVFGWKPPLVLTGIIVGLFAIFHGFAHGQNMPSASSPISYGIGFVLGSGTLHLIGIIFGMLTRFSWGLSVLRIGGAIIALTGFAVLFGLI